MFIPIELQKLMQQTQTPVARLTLQFATDYAQTDSRLGGDAVFKTDEALPDALFLGLIDFKKLPQSLSSVLPQSGYLVLFMPKQLKLGQAIGIQGFLFDEQTTLSRHPMPEDEAHPIFGAHLIEFLTATDYAGLDTLEAAETLQQNPFELLEDIALNPEEEAMFFDNYQQTIAAEGHKLLGYPAFIADDVRDSSEMTLLMQIDSDDAQDNDILWGDFGRAFIFIDKAALKRHDFSHLTLYIQD